jgi:hypothetical protein
MSEPPTPFDRIRHSAAAGAIGLIADAVAVSTAIVAAVKWTPLRQLIDQHPLYFFIGGVAAVGVLLALAMRLRRKLDNLSVMHAQLARQNVELKERLAGPSSYDKAYFAELMDDLHPRGAVMSWLRDHYLAKAMPAHVSNTIHSLVDDYGSNSFGFHNERLKDSYSALMATFTDFREAMLDYLFTDGVKSHWVSIPTEWQSDDPARWTEALDRLRAVHGPLLPAYEQFMNTAKDVGLEWSPRPPDPGKVD